MSVNVTIGPDRESETLVRRAARRGVAVFPAGLAWSGQRMPTGPKVMQSGQIPRPQSEHET